MLRTFFLTAALAGLAPTADAGDIKVRFGYDSRGGIRVGVGLSSDCDHRHRHQVRHVDRVWVPGHYDRVAYQVWVPARRERVRVPARYVTRRLPCGQAERVLVRRAHYETRIIPGHHVTRYKRVYHPGRWEVRRHVHRARPHTRPVAYRDRDFRRDNRIRNGRNRRGIESLDRGKRGRRYH
ncbi:MAG: hypothetical protein ACYTHK_01035 [Planctomycetota bacterium]|jgi:hypothetical protein